MTTKTLKPIGDPKRMRPSVARSGFNYSDPIGEHLLADGRVALVLWVQDTQQHVHVVVWVPGTNVFETVEHIATVNAAVESEKLLRRIEGSA